MPEKLVSAPRKEHFFVRKSLFVARKFVSGIEKMVFMLAKEHFLPRNSLFPPGSRARPRGSWFHS